MGSSMRRRRAREPEAMQGGEGRGGEGRGDEHQQRIMCRTGV
jgi:hypothetical protein